MRVFYFILILVIIFIAGCGETQSSKVAGHKLGASGAIGVGGIRKSSGKIVVSSGETFTCNKTVSGSGSTEAINVAALKTALESSVSEASTKEVTICLESGKFGLLKFRGLEPAHTVTVRPALGATVSLGGVISEALSHASGTGAKNLTFSHLNMTGHAVEFGGEALNISFLYDKFGIVTTGTTTSESSVITELPPSAVEKIVPHEAVYASNVSTLWSNIAAVKKINSVTSVEIGPPFCEGEQKGGFGPEGEKEHEAQLICKAGETEKWGEKVGSEYVARALSSASHEEISFGPTGGVSTSNTSGVDKQENFVIEHNNFSGIGPCPRYDYLDYPNKAKFNAETTAEKEHDPNRANCQAFNFPCLKSTGNLSHVKFNNNVCGPYITTHFMQPGGSNVEVDHDLFTGPGASGEGPANVVNFYEHTNILQESFGAEHVKISNSVAINTEPSGAFIFESPTTTTSDPIKDIKMENILEECNEGTNCAAKPSVVDGAAPILLCPVNGAKITNVTIAGGQFESAVGRAAGTGNCDTNEGKQGEKYTVEHDIFIGHTSPTQHDVGFGNCTGECVFNFLVSQDAEPPAVNGTYKREASNEGQAAGSTHVARWTPTFENTTWSPLPELEEEKLPKVPSNFFVATGLPFEAGFNGKGGPE